MILATTASARADDPPRLEPRADGALRQMAAYLGSFAGFGLRADLTYDTISADGQTITYGAVIHAWRGPRGLRVHYDGDERKTDIVFDLVEGRFTRHDLRADVYAQLEIPSDLDAALDLAFAATGSSVPIADLFYSDPHRVLTENVRSGGFVGLHPVGGARCHHLAFRQDEIDWQIWIEAGPRPVPRRLSISYESEPGSPQYVATISEWSLEPHVSPAFFTFRPSSTASEVEFLVATDEEAAR